MCGVLASSVLCVMLHGCLAQWFIDMPRNITAISGSCIGLPCGFTIPAQFDGQLNASEALWLRGKKDGPKVLTSKQYMAPGFEGEMLGDIQSKNCTSVFTQLPLGFSDALYFRLAEPTEGPAALRYTYPKEVFISFQTESVPPPVLSVSPLGEVRAGTELTLRCRAMAPCPSLPPDVRLRRQVDSTGGSSTLQVGFEQGMMFVTTTQHFTVTAKDHGLNVTCEAEYPRRNGRESHREVQSMTLNILYAPRNTRVVMSLPSPVPMGRQVTLGCLSEANPPATSYNWYTVNGAGDQLVLRATGQKHLVLMTSRADSGRYVCEAVSLSGVDRSAFVALEVDTEGQQCCTVLYAFCGLLACMSVLTLLVDIYKYKRLMKCFLDHMQTAKDQDTLSGPYANLTLSEISPDYEQIQPNSALSAVKPGSQKTGDKGQAGPSQRRQRAA